MTKVLFISYDGMTDPLGQSQVLPYLTGLSKKGYSIHLISFEKEEVFEKNKQLIQKICDTSSITWHPEKYTKRPPVISTIRDIRRMRRSALDLHKLHSFGIAHCRSYIAIIVGLILQKKGSKLVFDMRGFWADERVDGKIWNLNNPIYKFIYNYFKSLERKALSKANAVVSLTHAAKEEMVTWKIKKLKPDKISVIPCCVDLNLFDPEKISRKNQQNLKKELSIENDSTFVLGYIGSIGTWYLLEEMLHFFKLLLIKKPDSLFLFVTKEPRKKIISEAQMQGIDPSKIRVTSAPRYEVPLHISLFDTSIFFISNSYSKKASSPTKQAELMAMGIPIICNSGVGDSQYFIEKHTSGHVIKTLNTEHFNQILDPTIFLQKKFFSTDRTFEGCAETFSLENGVIQYELIYQKLLSSFD
jgi:glycosyltransferase involved in cell wall biosynthesis